MKTEKVAKIKNLFRFLGGEIDGHFKGIIIVATLDSILIDSRAEGSNRAKEIAAASCVVF